LIFQFYQYPIIAICIFFNLRSKISITFSIIGNFSKIGRKIRKKSIYTNVSIIFSFVSSDWINSCLYRIRGSWRRVSKLRFGTNFGSEDLQGATSKVLADALRKIFEFFRSCFAYTSREVNTSESLSVDSDFQRLGFWVIGKVWVFLACIWQKRALSWLGDDDIAESVAESDKESDDKGSETSLESSETLPESVLPDWRFFCRVQSWHL